MYDIDLTDKSFHARVNPQKRQKKSMIIKLLFVAFCERKMSNRITKEWSDIYVCHTILMSVMLYNAKRKHHITLIYDKSFHI